MSSLLGHEGNVCYTTVPTRLGCRHVLEERQSRTHLRQSLVNHESTISQPSSLMKQQRYAKYPESKNTRTVWNKELNTGSTKMKALFRKWWLRCIKSSCLMRYVLMLACSDSIWMRFAVNIGKGTFNNRCFIVPWYVSVKGKPNSPHILLICCVQCSGSHILKFFFISTAHTHRVLCGLATNTKHSLVESSPTVSIVQWLKRKLFTALLWTGPTICAQFNQGCSSRPGPV